MYRDRPEYLSKEGGREITDYSVRGCISYSGERNFTITVDSR